MEPEPAPTESHRVRPRIAIISLSTLLPSLEPAGIAAKTAGLDRRRIDAYKHSDLAVTKLSWEHESARIVDAYRQPVPRLVRR